MAYIVCEWLKRIKPNSTTLYDPRIKSKSVQPWGVRRNFSKGTTSKIGLSFSDCWRCNTNGGSQNALPLLPISLYWLNLNSQSFAWNVFYTLAIRNAFSFHKLSNIQFFEHFLQVSQFKNIQRPEQHERWKNRKLNTLTKMFQAMRSRTICWQDYRTTYWS